jgi:colicin import membrane protein
LLSQALSALNNASKIDGEKQTLATHSTAPATTLLEDNMVAASESLIAMNEGSTAKSGDVSYYQALVRRLKDNLHLPVYGQVKVDITLQRSGKVVKVKIISCTSGSNNAYLQKELCKLSFPSFGSNFVGEEQHTFHLCLENEVSY